MTRHVFHVTRPTGCGMDGATAATAATAAAAAAAATAPVVFVCQRCKLPLRLDGSLLELDAARYQALVGACFPCGVRPQWVCDA
jgi:hypothetical protein